MVKVNNELTAVGSPVVYACRFSGAQYGKTCLNQPAFEEAVAKIGDENFVFSEIEMDLKHEGKAVAYEVNIKKGFEVKAPDWDALIIAHADI